MYIRRCITITKKLENDIIKRAKQEDRSVSNMVRIALEQYLGANNE